MFWSKQDIIITLTGELTHLYLCIQYKLISMLLTTVFPCRIDEPDVCLADPDCGAGGNALDLIIAGISCNPVTDAELSQKHALLPVKVHC